MDPVTSVLDHYDVFIFHIRKNFKACLVVIWDGAAAHNVVDCTFGIAECLVEVRNVLEVRVNASDIGLELHCL